MKFKISLQNSPFDMPQSEDHRTHCFSTKPKSLFEDSYCLFGEKKKRIFDLLLYPKKTEFLTITHQWRCDLSCSFLAGQKFFISWYTRDHIQAGLEVRGKFYGCMSSWLTIQLTSILLYCFFFPSIHVCVIMETPYV